MRRILRVAIAAPFALLSGVALAQNPDGSTVLSPDVQRMQNPVITPSGGNPSQTPGQSQYIEIDNSKNGSIQVQPGATGTPAPGAQQTPPIIVQGTQSPQMDPTGQAPRVKGRSTTVCGGAGQEPCPPTLARLAGFARADCGMKTQADPSRDPNLGDPFFDLTTWSCWSCPKGYSRDVTGIDTDRACSKIDKSAKHDYRYATYGGHPCESPAFYDPIRGGECWKCPEQYERTWSHVEASDACISKYGTKKKAQLIGTAQCGPGEFHDPKSSNPARGGSCWSCPQGADRTVFPVDGPWACEMDWTRLFSRATREAGLSCERDEIYDPVDGKSDVVATKKRKGGGPSPLEELNDRRRALGLKPLDKTTGATCWKCPPGSKRTMAPVYGDSACVSDIVWASAPYQQPGLFGLPGAESIAADLVRDGTLINTIADGMAPALNLKPADARRRIWLEIAVAPEASAVLKTAVLSLVEGAVSTPDAVSHLSPEMQRLIERMKASPEMQKLLDNTAKEMQAFAVFLAQDALNAHDAWRAGYEYSAQSRYKRSVLQDAFEYGKQPPDFEAITAENILASTLPPGAASSALTISMLQRPVFEKIFPHTLRKTFQPSEASLKVAQAGGQEVAEEIANNPVWKQAARRASTRAIEEVAEAAVEETAKQVGKRVLAEGLEFSFGTVLAFSAGPQIIITISVELISISIEQFADISQARPKLVARLYQAQNVRPDLARLMLTPDGQADIERRWTLLMAGTTAPFERTRFALSGPDIEARVALAAGKGMSTSQVATANAPSTAATITNTPVPAATNAAAGRHPTTGPIAAVPAATPSTGKNTTATGAGPTATAGASASSTQGTAAPAPVVAVAHPEALDIAVGPSGTVWFTGKTDPANAADKLIYYVTPQGPKPLPSGAAVRIAVDATNNPWVVNSLGHLFRWDGTKWLYIRANVKDIALNAGNRIWALDASGIAHRWDGGNTWTPAVQKEGHLGAAIAVDPGGNPWLVSRVGDIWRMQNGAWQKLQGWATDVAIAADGTAFVVGTAGQIWKMAPGAAGWEMVPGAIGIHVGAGPAGTVHYTK